MVACLFACVNNGWIHVWNWQQMYTIGETPDLLFLYLLFTGAACVVFSSHASYIAAVSARFMQLNYGSLDKKVLSQQHCTRYA